MKAHFAFCVPFYAVLENATIPSACSENTALTPFCSQCGKKTETKTGYKSRITGYTFASDVFLGDPTVHIQKSLFSSSESTLPYHLECNPRTNSILFFIGEEKGMKPYGLYEIDMEVLENMKKIFADIKVGEQSLFENGRLKLITF